MSLTISIASTCADVHVERAALERLRDSRAGRLSDTSLTATFLKTVTDYGTLVDQHRLDTGCAEFH